MSQEEISPEEQKIIIELENLVKSSPLGLEILETPYKNGFTPAWIAARNGWINVLRYLVNNAPSGAEILEKTFAWGVTIAWGAAWYENINVMEFLIEHSPSGKKILEIMDNWRRTPALIAAHYGCVKMVEYLVKNSPDHCGILTDTMPEDIKQRLTNIETLRKEIIEDYLLKEYQLVISFLEKINDTECVVFTVINIIMQQTQLLLK